VSLFAEEVEERSADVGGGHGKGGIFDGINGIYQILKPLAEASFALR
jgi:hypothetical protein